MKKIVVGNWKMNPGPPMDQVKKWAVSVTGMSGSTEVVISPSMPFISTVSAAVEGTTVSVSAQDCSFFPMGAYTGDANAVLLKGAGASFVIVGHSERRTKHNETNEDVRKKAAEAINAGLVPIICIGETEAERDAGKAEEIVGQQVRESIPDKAKNNRFILAYEPVWAIGTGKTPTSDDIRAMHAYIMVTAAQRTGLAPETISVLYGGSVKADNASSIMAIAGVAGVLVGGASLQPEEFDKIISAAAG